MEPARFDDALRVEGVVVRLFHWEIVREGKRQVPQAELAVVVSRAQGPECFDDALVQILAAD